MGVPKKVIILISRFRIFSEINQPAIEVPAMASWKARRISGRPRGVPKWIWVPSAASLGELIIQDGHYPLFEWVNQLFLWPFSIAMLSLEGNPREVSIAMGYPQMVGF